MRKKPYLVGISGGSGCGKTTVLNALIEHMPLNSIALISQDNYYKDIHLQPLDNNGKVNFDTPESFRRNELISDIERLSQGESISKTEYTFNNENRTAGEVLVHPAPIILVEGLFVFHFDEISRLLDYKVFIETQENHRLERRIKRDWEERGYPKEEVLYQWENHVMPAFNSFLLPHVASCDLVIDNNDHFESDLQVLARHLQGLIS